MTAEFDMQELIDEITSAVETAVEGSVNDYMEDAVTNAMQDILPEALAEALSDFVITLGDGTVITPKKHMRLLSPDKSKMLICYGGLKADGCCLNVQTRISSWENIAKYPTHEEAVQALLKVKKAIDEGLSSFEL